MSLAAQVIQMLTEIEATDFVKSPGFRFIASLREKLIACDFTSEEAEHIVSSMNLSLPEGSLTDEELDTFVVLYCKIVVKARRALEALGFDHTMPALLKMAEKLSLTFS